MTSVLITGANRGIGLGLTRHLLSDPSVTIVITTARYVKSAMDLYIPKLHIIQLEVVNEDSIANAVNQVSEIVGEKGLDILINNAGIGSDKPLNGDISQFDCPSSYCKRTHCKLIAKSEHGVSIDTSPEALR